jgi:hypothetical protein
MVMVIFNNIKIFYNKIAVMSLIYQNKEKRNTKRLFTKFKKNNLAKSVNLYCC